MKFLLLALIVPAFVFGSELYSLMNFSPVSDSGRELFNRLGFDVVQVYEDGSVDFVANSTERRILLENGLIASTRIPDMEGYYRSINGTTRSMGGFYTWDEVSSWMDSLVAANPSITSVQSIGNTYEGRPQRVVKLSVNNSFSADDPSMPNAWYDGMIHAREGASMRNIRYWMMWLCSNYQRNGYNGYQATWILENREIWCLPLNNIDGWVYNQTTSPGGGGMHRKNRNTSAGGNGIDLNRNWSVAWGGAGSSGDPGSETYRGTAPLSEPECSNIDTFWQTHIPAQMHSTHSYSNVLIYPWGWTDEPTTHAAEYTTQGEMMVLCSTGEEHAPAAEGLYYASGNTRDHSYALYGSMSWNHETGAGFAGFWPSATEIVKLSRRNLRSYLLSACLAGCPYDPHEPGVPIMENIGTVSVPFTVNWGDAGNADYYALQRLSGYQVLLNDTGDSGPFDRVNWIITSSQYHSGTQSYLSNGTGQMTWQGTVTVPAEGGGRISFWSLQDITPESYQGAFSYSPDGGQNWYYLQTFGREDMTWRYNIHELDEFQGRTLMFRWESYGGSSSCKLFIDDIKIEVWNSNQIQADNISGSQYTVSELNNGDYWFRAWAIDTDFGPGWASEPVLAQVNTTGGGESSEELFPRVSSLGLVTPNPVYALAVIPVSISPGDASSARLVVYDVSGRVIEDLSPSLTGPGSGNVIWNTQGVPAGVHFVRLETLSGTTTRRVITAGR